LVKPLRHIVREWDWTKREFGLACGGQQLESLDTGGYKQARNLLRGHPRKPVDGRADVFLREY